MLLLLPTTRCVSGGGVSEKNRQWGSSRCHLDVFIWWPPLGLDCTQKSTRGLENSLRQIKAKEKARSLWTFSSSTKLVRGPKVNSKEVVPVSKEGPSRKYKLPKNENIFGSCTTWPNAWSSLVSAQSSIKFCYCPWYAVSIALYFHKHNSLPLAISY